MVGETLITQELIEAWRKTIGSWVDDAHGRGAEFVIVIYDSGDLEFRPMFVFPEQSVSIVMKTLPSYLKAVAVVMPNEDEHYNDVLLSICHFFRPVIEN